MLTGCTVGVSQITCLQHRFSCIYALGSLEGLEYLPVHDNALNIFLMRHATIPGNMIWYDMPISGMFGVYKQVHNGTMYVP